MPKTKRTKIRRWILSRVPPWIRERDFQIFASILIFVAGLPLLFGEPAPGSIESALPPLLIKVWASVLVIGPVAIFVGAFMGYRRRFPERITWMRVEAWGLTALAYACYGYAAVILAAEVPGSGIPVAMVLTLGIVSHLREASIQLDVADFKEAIGIGTGPD